MQVVFRARSLARLNTGSNNPARIARMAMTTSNSIKVKAPGLGCGASGSVRPGTFMFIWTADMANAHAARRVAKLYARLPLAPGMTSQFYLYLALFSSEVQVRFQRGRQ